MSDQLNINEPESGGGIPQVLNFGIIGYLVFIGLYIWGLSDIWDQSSGFFAVPWKLVKYTVVYILLGGVGGIIGNALRLYAMPMFFVTDGSMKSILKVRMFWAFVPQSIGIIIGFFIALGIANPSHTNVLSTPQPPSAISETAKMESAPSPSSSPTPTPAPAPAPVPAPTTEPAQQAPPAKTESPQRQNQPSSKLAPPLEATQHQKELSKKAHKDLQQEEEIGNSVNKTQSSEPKKVNTKVSTDIKVDRIVETNGFVIELKDASLYGGKLTIPYEVKNKGTNRAFTVRTDRDKIIDNFGNEYNRIQNKLTSNVLYSQSQTIETMETVKGEITAKVNQNVTSIDLLFVYFRPVKPNMSREERRAMYIPLEFKNIPVIK